MTDWNKGQLILLVGACIAVFGSVYFLAARGPEPIARAPLQPAESPPPAVESPMPRPSAAATAVERIPTKTQEPSPVDEGLRRMAENPSAGDVAYLGDLAQRDGDPQLRLVAIEGLQRAAISGSDGGASSRALRQLAASRDPQISHAARTAISQVSQQRAEE